MSGLESIALAVAHLEEMKRVSMERDETIESSSENLGIVNGAPEPPPAPQSFSSISNTARVVSVDSLTSTSFSDECDGKIKETTPAAIAASKRFAEILADPGAWLESTETLSIPVAPTDVFSKVLQDDVLCGRGGETNHHQGNIQYRNLVKAFQPLYIASKRRDKPRIAQCIVYTIRKHGGRFLKRTDARSSTWVDVGNTKAREKTSQALREGAPELRGDEKGQPQQQQRSASPAAVVAAPAVPVNYMANTVVPHPLFHHPHHGFAHHRPVGLTPLQQAMSRTIPTPPSAAGIPMVTPIPSAQRFLDQLNSSRKRINFAATVSDGDSSDASCTSGATSPANAENSSLSVCQGPRLKRLKQRLEMQDLS